ncbi:GvpL/GvpF family gas vesicle protein [Rhodococcus sp. NPDC056960]|uniref:GvpL/GvpF family gas vesicle protein n=1 Tax=Rhodococcus sp. NPDC056960 TaxID=3345982 RepID=UPI003637A1FD
MTSSEDTDTDTDTADNNDEGARAVGIYVYGIVPADVQPEEDATGIHDAPIDIVTHGDIAALVSEIDPAQRLGTPADLRAHARILDGTSRVAPVLPLRFGAVVSDRDAVINELLAEHENEFSSALEALEGCAQYLVRGRYVEEAIIREIVDENPKATSLLESLREQPEELTRDARMALGEIIGNTLAAKRETDTGTALDALAPLTDTMTVREPTHDEDAVQIAVLLEVDRQDELEQTVGDLAARWDDRVTMRLVGPMAPYDFVVAPKPED